ncbi:hypothetical protein PDJAM_G00217840 [Pangasius djambal]|uniref:Uncharacterized protein n=1 Tax=Pangasius djambal TaxID=1691987 RepID=A0ACC5YBE0_9TELE|nr:hypothetical protein [Pangasius djambal]
MEEPLTKVELGKGQILLNPAVCPLRVTSQSHSLSTLKMEEPLRKVELGKGQILLNPAVCPLRVTSQSHSLSTLKMEEPLRKDGIPTQRDC